MVTVSPTFALEMQSPLLGAGIDPWIRDLAKENKLTGIINGSVAQLWDPASHRELKNWLDPDTGEAIDLSFKAEEGDLLEKKALIRTQVMKWLHKYYPQVVEKNKLNLTKGEIVLYVGRYDSSQKGLEKFSLIRDVAVQNKASFITLGVAEDPKATIILDQLEEESKQLEGCWITRGKKRMKA